MVRDVQMSYLLQHHCTDDVIFHHRTDNVVLNHCTDDVRRDVQMSFSYPERQCCQSNFFARIILGGLPLPSHHSDRAEICNLFNVPVTTHQLFAEDTVRSLMSMPTTGTDR